MTLDAATLFGQVVDQVKTAIIAIVPLGLSVFGLIWLVRKGIQTLRASAGR